MLVVANVFPHFPGEGIRYTKRVNMPDTAFPTTESEVKERSRKAIAHLWPQLSPAPATDAFIGNGFCLCRGHAYEVWWQTDAWLESTNRMYQSGRFVPESFPRSEQ